MCSYNPAVSQLYLDLEGVSAALTPAATEHASSAASGYLLPSLAQTLSGNWTANGEDLCCEIKRIECRSRTPRSALRDTTTTRKKIQRATRQDTQYDNVTTTLTKLTNKQSESQAETSDTSTVCNREEICRSEVADHIWTLFKICCCVQCVSVFAPNSFKL